MNRESSLETPATSLRRPASPRLGRLPLASAGGAWLAVVLLAVGLFVAGLPVRRDELDAQYAGLFPADFAVNAASQVILTPWREGQGLVQQDAQLTRLGVLQGDILLAVDGRPVGRQPGQFVPEGWLSGPLGSTMTITVRTGNGAPRTYSVTRGGPAAADLASLGLSRDFITAFGLGTELAFGGVFLILAAALFWRRSDDWLALLVSAALVMVFVGASSPVIALYRSVPSFAPVLDLWFSLALLALLWFFYLFPGGHFFPRWTAALAGALILAAVLAVAQPALYPWRMPPAADFLIILATLASGLGAQVARYREAATAVQRQQTKWVLVGLVTAILGFLAKFWLQVVNWPPPTIFVVTLYNLVLYPLAMVLQVLLPVSIVVGILRYRLFDIDTLINRALVYAALSAAVFGLYVLVVCVLGALLQTSGNLLVSLAATMVVAVLFQPLRERVQRGVNRLLYGERDEPYAVISRLGRRLEAAFQPGAVLPAIVETVAQALKLPYAAITLREEDAPRVAAQYGTAQADLLRLPLVYAGEPLGELLLAPRATGEPFTAGDHRLLADLARQAGVAAHAVQLHTDLERSRRRIVVAREEARRKLGSDLHDGVGHRLAGLLRRQELAAQLLRDDPAAAEATLRELNRQTRATIAEVRALAHTLHPPDLALLGLPDALRERAAELSTAGESGLQVTLDAPAALPALPAAVEVAAYYIAQEALTNVVRHARARHATLSLRLHTTGAGPGRQGQSTLELEIRDDGTGPREAAPGTGGLGLASMRERASELGGTCLVEAAPGGGTRVRATLPCPADQ